MQIPIYQVDAFTGERFHGNPAAVCPLTSWPEDALLHCGDHGERVKISGEAVVYLERTISV